MSGISLHMNTSNSFDTAIGTAQHHQQRLSNEMTDFHDVRKFFIDLSKSVYHNLSSSLELISKIDLRIDLEV